MRKLIHKVMALWDREEGQGLVEYALILVLVSIVAIGTLKFLGGSISTILSDVGSTLTPP